MDLDILKQRAKAFDYLFDAVVVTDIQGTIIDWNKGSEALYGYSKKEVIGQDVSILHVPEDFNHVTAGVIASVEKMGKWSGEVRMLHKNGHIGWIESMCIPIFDDANKMIGALGINRDITERKTELARLHSLAHYDQLTAIPNRYSLLDRLEHLIAQCERSKSQFTLLYMDLDKFKIINDTKGHAFGDQLLKEVALRLSKLIRQSDTFARIGGDEFVFLLENTSHKNDIAVMAEMILKELDRVFVINDEEIKISCSLGVAIYPEDGSTMDALLTAGDVAMYKAKQGGRGTYKF
ncbi:MAG: sensor domain-containing diguanylate cyclase [Thiomicrorhabdus sp.]|jgi:diguanylate cyclase (GGDEF)-like protein/PAS domain S-box-containing protein|nr:sensor domain-containing diguanylate cyclase [Thiomicrorhabdus sp.]